MVHPQCLAHKPGVTALQPPLAPAAERRRALGQKGYNYPASRAVPIPDPHPALLTEGAAGSGLRRCRSGSRLPPPAGAAGLPRRRSGPFPNPELPSPAPLLPRGARCRCGRSPGTAPPPQVPPRGRPARPGPRRRLPGLVRGCGCPDPAGQRLRGMEESGMGPPRSHSEISQALGAARLLRLFDGRRSPTHVQPKDGTSGFVHSSVESKGSNW